MRWLAAKSYQVKAVNEQVHAIALWDESWQSYNNCYLVESQGAHTLIDCGKAEQGDQLLAALGDLGCAPGAISHLIVTHGHKDHYGGYVPFAGAVKYIHRADRPRLSAEVQGLFVCDLPDDGGVLDFRCIHLGTHTPGSVGLFHPASGTLFVGDHICFFGDSLPGDGLVSTGPELREFARNLVSSWASDPEDRVKWHFDEFLLGLRALGRFPAGAFCTGHGGVLVGEVGEFLEGLIGLDVS